MKTMSETNPSRSFRERRRNLRVTPDPLLIIRLASGNHGIVLDLSHGGVGFLAGAAVEEGQEVGFTFTTKSEPMAEGTGTLMWKDSSGKRAGLKFTHLPDELRALLHSYLQREKSKGEIPSEPATSAADAADRERALPTASRNAEDVHQTWSGSISGEAKSGSVRLPSKSVRLLANMVTSALACVIAVAIWYSVDRRDALHSASHFKQGLSRLLTARRLPHLPHVSIQAMLAKFTKEPKTQTITVHTNNISPPPVAEPAPPAPSVPATAAAIGAESAAARLITTAQQQQSAVETQTPESSIAPGSPSPAQLPAVPTPTNAKIESNDQANAAKAPEQGQDELALAHGLLKSDDPLARSKAASLLWQAVGKGNTAAEIELADLYLAGEVLPKSCSQARILLTAAQNRKSEIAAGKMNELAKYGCE